MGDVSIANVIRMGRSKGRYTHKPYCKLKAYHQPRLGFQQKIIRNLQNTCWNLSRSPGAHLLHQKYERATTRKSSARKHSIASPRANAFPFPACSQSGRGARHALSIHTHSSNYLINRCRNITRQALLKENGGAKDDVVQLALALKREQRLFWRMLQDCAGH